jgi:uncharacterized protein (PEP-CTERM system associated)
MAITTLKLPRMAPMALALLAIAPPGHAGWRLTPAVALTETWTDNVNHQADGQERSTWVTQATPALTLVGNTPRVRLFATHEWHYFAYAGKQPQNTWDSQRQYLARMDAQVVDELLFVDAAASRTAQAISAFGENVNGNLWSMGNRGEVSTWRVSPVLRHRFGGTLEASARYSRDSVKADRNLLGSSEGASWTASVASGRNFQNVRWSLDYAKQELDNQLAGHSSSETALASVRVRASRTFSVLASGGYDSYDYRALGGRTSGRNWSGGFAWTPSSRTSLEASWGRRFFGPSGALSASHRSRHSMWHARYSDTITTSRSQFLLPASFDTASMLDKLFAPSFPDPVARAQAVATYMKASGLPASLADNVNYFSNRYFRQRQFGAGTVFSGAHSDLALGVYDVRREAQSVQQSDSSLLGSQLAQLSEDVRQRGIDASFNYRLGKRSAVRLASGANRTESLSTGRIVHGRTLRLGVTHQFSQGMYGALEVRRTSGSAGLLGDRNFAEHALSASLSIQL